MRKHLTNFGLLSSALSLITLCSATALALPPQANAHAQTTDTMTSSSSDMPTDPTAGQAHHAAAMLRACQNREQAITNIMQRIDTRGQNQLTLFGTIATRVENFSTAKGKTVANYDQLTTAIATAKAKAQTDLGSLQSATFSCTDSNPKGMVTTFQGYLKTEISDLQAYRTAVKNLIVAVAHANKVTVTDSSQSTDTGSQQ